MNPWKVILATVVIFGTGVVTGGLLVRYYQFMPARHGQHGVAVHPGQTGMGGTRMEFLRRAQRELDLSPAQRERIDAIIREGQDRTKKLMEPISLEVHQELLRTRQEFREALTSEQRTRFDEFLKQQQQRSHEQRRSPGAHNRSLESGATNDPATRAQ